VSAYVIANIEVHDRERYGDYVALSPKTVVEHGGRYLVRSEDGDALEGNCLPKRIVVVEFTTRRAARAWYGSTDYRAARAIRQECASSSLILVDGL
jgi:uncharacterized protein (DUF1330 family)